MKFLHALVPALAAACLLSSSVIAADAPPQPPPGDRGGPGGGPGGPMSFLTPEEHMMLFAQMREDTAGMKEEQRHAYMDKQFARFKSMSDADKRKFAVDLKTKWDALPPERKAQIEKEMDEMRKHPPGGPGGPPGGPNHP